MDRIGRYRKNIEGVVDPFPLAHNGFVFKERRMLGKHILDRVEEILAERPAYEGFLRFFGRVLVLMIEEEERIRAEGIFSETPEPADGFPLLKPSDFSVCEESLRRMFKGLGGPRHRRERTCR